MIIKQLQHPEESLIFIVRIQDRQTQLHSLRSCAGFLLRSKSVTIAQRVTLSSHLPNTRYAQNERDRVTSIHEKGRQF